MENQPLPYKARRKTTQPVITETGTSSQPPQDPAVQKVTPVTQKTVSVTSMTRIPEREVASSTPSSLLMNAAKTERIMREFQPTLNQKQSRVMYLQRWQRLSGYKKRHRDSLLWIFHPDRPICKRQPLLENYHLPLRPQVQKTRPPFQPLSQIYNMQRRQNIQWMGPWRRRREQRKEVG